MCTMRLYYVGDEDDGDDQQGVGQMVWAWCVLFGRCGKQSVHLAAVTGKVGLRLFDSDRIPAGEQGWQR
jgi:hypothetical protein